MIFEIVRTWVGSKQRETGIFIQNTPPEVLFWDSLFVAEFSVKPCNSATKDKKNCSPVSALLRAEKLYWWRWGELNPCPNTAEWRYLHACSAVKLLIVNSFCLWTHPGLDYSSWNLVPCRMSERRNQNAWWRRLCLSVRQAQRRGRKIRLPGQTLRSHLFV